MANSAAAAAAPRSSLRPVVFVAAMAAAVLLSLAGAGLALPLAQLFEPDGSIPTNGDMLLALAGYALAATLVVWTAAFFFYRRRRSLGFGVKTLLGAWLVVLVVDALWVFLSVIPATNTADNATLTAIQQRYGRPRADADLADYTRQLSSLGMPGIITAQGLAHGELAQTTSRIEQIQTLIAKEREVAEGRIVALRAAVATSSLSPAYKRRALQIIDDQLPAQRGKLERYWDGQATLFRALSQYVAFLKANRGSWVAEGERISWSRADLMARSKAITAPIGSILAGRGPDRQSSPR